MKEKIEIDATFRESPEQVWEALTDSEALSMWLMPTDFKPLIGYRFRLERSGQTAIEGKVIEVEPQRLLAYTWRDEEDGPPSKVIWTLEPKVGGTHLRLEHIAIEEPVVNCLAIDNYFNWMYALRHSLPGLMRLLQGLDRMPRVPITYVAELPHPRGERVRA